MLPSDCAAMPMLWSKLLRSVLAIDPLEKDELLVRFAKSQSRRVRFAGIGYATRPLPAQTAGTIYES